MQNYEHQQPGYSAHPQPVIVARKVGHMVYAVACAAAWFVVNPIVFLVAASSGTDAGLVTAVFIMFVVGWAPLILWIVKAVQVSQANKRLADAYNAHIQQQYYGGTIHR